MTLSSSCVNAPPGGTCCWCLPSIANLQFLSSLLLSIIYYYYYFYYYHLFLILIFPKKCNVAAWETSDQPSHSAVEWIRMELKLPFNLYWLTFGTLKKFAFLTAYGRGDEGQSDGDQRRFGCPRHHFLQSAIKINNNRLIINHRGIIKPT